MGWYHCGRRFPTVEVFVATTAKVLRFASLDAGPGRGVAARDPSRFNHAAVAPSLIVALVAYGFGPIAFRIVGLPYPLLLHPF